jgi:hypothetical protein
VVCQVKATGSTYAAAGVTVNGAGLKVVNGFSVLDGGLNLGCDTLAVAQTSGSTTGKVLSVQSTVDTFGGDLIVAQLPNTALGTDNLLRLRSIGNDKFTVGSSTTSCSTIAGNCGGGWR